MSAWPEPGAAIVTEHPDRSLTIRFEPEDAVRVLCTASLLKMLTAEVSEWRVIKRRIELAALGEEP